MLTNINKELANKISDEGIFFVPATEHYPELLNPVVNCDYCLRSNINISIGCDIDGKKYDICTICVHALSNNKVSDVLPKVCPLRKKII